MIKTFSELPQFLSQKSVDGCFADTSVLFSFSFPFDIFNEKAELAIRPLSQKNISIFTNVNVKSEFLESHRRVLIPECLIDFYDDFHSDMDNELSSKLEKFKKIYRENMRKEKAVKFDIGQIATYRRLLRGVEIHNSNGWQIFCSRYLNGKLSPLWDGLRHTLNIQTLSLHNNDMSFYLNSEPDWSDAISIMGRYGIGSNDAMILNMFLCSNIPILLTADVEMAEVALQESNGTKTIFLPDKLLSSAQ